jgi:hypothetical protein
MELIKLIFDDIHSNNTPSVFFRASLNNSSVEIYEQNGGFAAEKRGKGRVNYFF